MKIATWNVNSIRARIEIVTNYLRNNDLDVIAIQETKTTDEFFPKNTFEELGYEACYSGQKAYNGVAIVSRLKMMNIRRDVVEANNEKRTIETNIDDLTIINAYFPHGGLRGEERFFFKLEFYKRMKNYLKSKINNGEKIILLGDFNVAPEQIDVWSPTILEGTIGFMNEEREAFKDLLSIGLVDTFREYSPNGKAFSWWDYRAGAFRKNEGMRIDHILIGMDLVPRLKNCYIDREPREIKGTSDHAPVVADLD